MKALLSIKSTISITIICFLIFVSLISNAVIISVPINNTVLSINDPENLLFTNLGLTVNVGDSFTAGYTVDDANAANSVSLGGVLHNLSDPSFNHNANFGVGGSVSGFSTYRITILDDFSGADIWGISAAVGSGVDGDGNGYLHILDIAS